jgi:hypothetical protein
MKFVNELEEEEEAAEAAEGAGLLLVDGLSWESEWMS